MPKKSLEDQIEKQVLDEIKPNKHINYLAAFSNLVEIVENEDGKFEYLIFNPVTKKCFTSPTVEIDGKVFEPPPKRLLPHNLLFPAKEKVLHYMFERENSPMDQTISSGDVGDVNSDDNYNKTIDKNVIFLFDIELYNQIIDYYRSRAELPEENLYDICATWAFHTYTMERADFSPIIYFLGLPEKGKSRMLKSMIYIAKRGLRKISITDAQILRDCTNIDATLALDMMNLWGKIEKAGSEDVFLNRPEKGIDVSRVNRPEKGAFQDTDYYTVFGPTIFATNENIHEILDTRAIPIIMVNSNREFTTKVLPEDALEIKEKLTAWRASTMGNKWTNVGRIAKSRLGDITQPLYQVLMNINPERGEEFKQTVHKIEERRLAEKIDSTSGQIILALLYCQDQIESGCIKGQLIANKYNEGNLNSKYNTQSRTILNKLRAMGFETRTLSGGAMGVVWNEARIMSLKLEFGIDIETPKQELKQPDLYYTK
jgi:hypothetical protein